MASSFSYSFGYWWYKGKISRKSSSSSKVEKQSKHIVASMRIERYYTSVKEELSSMTDSALTLINNKDYIGFFNSCGSNYIRGIRRAQEVSAFLIFESTSTESSSDFSYKIQVSNWRGRGYDYGYSKKNKHNAESMSLTITILGYGLGINQEGSETLVARSIAEFKQVMKFAYKTMTQNKDSAHIGMVYGMEVVPWVANTNFQVASGLSDEIIEIPLPSSLIPKAYRLSDPYDTTFDDTSRGDFRCKNIAYEMDKFGLCCEISSLYNTDTKEYDDTSPEQRICRPLRQLDGFMVKENLVSNGEFIARLNKAVRYRVDQLSIVEKCISATKAIPKRFDYHIVKSKDKVKFDESMSLTFSVFELKVALDPFNDFSVVKYIAKEVDEFIEMFYQPCIAAIFGSTITVSSGVSPETMMAYPWHSHEECTRLSCFGSGMRWDRENGGCIPGLMSGVAASSYSTTGESNCKKELDNTGPVDSCKHNSAELDYYQRNITKCWGGVGVGRIDYFLDTFCLPEVSTETLDPRAQASIRESYIKECTDMEEKSMNVALNKPTKQSSTYGHTRHSPHSGLVVDGNTDGMFWRRSVSHTNRDSNPWWEVDLQRDYTIKEIVVYNRRDCCEGRLQGFKIYLYNDDQVAWSDTQTGAIGQMIRFSLEPNAVGDRVKIVIEGRSEYLQLTEVQVFNKFFE